MERREHPLEMAKPEPWFCELHRIRVTRDCPKCDDELIALSLQFEEGDWL